MGQADPEAGWLHREHGLAATNTESFTSYSEGLSSGGDNPGGICNTLTAGEQEQDDCLLEDHDVHRLKIRRKASTPSQSATPELTHALSSAAYMEP